MKKDYLTIFAVLFSVILFLVLLIHLLGGVADSEWHGFGVDSIGQIYIGKSTQIEVYRDREFITSIRIPRSRTYYFTVQDNDTILLSTSVNVYVLDFSGRELSCKPDERCALYNKLQWQREVEVKNGDHYYCRNVWGRILIEKDNGQIVYQTPIEGNGGIVTSLFVLAFLFAIASMNKAVGFFNK